MKLSSKHALCLAFAAQCAAVADSQDSGSDSLVPPGVSIQTTAAAATTAKPIATAADLSGSAPTPIAKEFESARERCPVSCSGVVSNSANWTVYHDVDRLSWCAKPMLLEFAVYNPLDDPETDVSIRACSNEDTTYAPEIPAQAGPGETACYPAKNELEVGAALELAWVDSPKPGDAAAVETAARQLLYQLAHTQDSNDTEASCRSTLLFSSYGAATVGLFAGSQMHEQRVDFSVLQQFIDQVHSNGISDTLLVQHCSTSTLGGNFAIGVVGNANNNSLPFVQETIKTWNDGKCITEFDGSSALQNITFWAPKPVTEDPKDDTESAVTERRRVQKRADCRVITVGANEYCGPLATRCGITLATFQSYNPGSTFCNNLAVGQRVCCTAGTLPDIRPKQNADGSCVSYTVPKDDNCSQIAARNGLTVANLESFNTNTWGWLGCANLQAQAVMCLSTGIPPMPAINNDAVCGPTVAGTSRPTNGENLADLNPCPLNACCSKWGSCGLTAEFCTVTASPTGAPGTSGCLSNCGTKIVRGDAPQTFRKVTYFEAFNNERPCLNMNISDMDTTKYTHVHLAFAKVTPDFDVDVSDIQDQFDGFVALQNISRVLSFGGWSFSTGHDSPPIFLKQFSNENRDTFIANLVKFVDTHGIDGLDFDWEYPNSPEVPGSSSIDGLNYFVFLYHLKKALPAGISVSIAAPASFYYLRGFPIKAMGELLDYIIYMTYDLHGQWDYGGVWANPGCPNGNCLRSHVNLTETISAMSMITKAGVESSKVVMGISSYGRGFEMTTPGCTGETCTFVGPESGATPGKCTGTAGYLANAEIDDIIAAGGSISTYYDDSYSNILVYDSVQWVAYMNETTKAARAKLYEQLHMGGTSDWAVDLQ